MDDLTNSIKSGKQNWKLMLEAKKHINTGTGGKTSSLEPSGPDMPLNPTTIPVGTQKPDSGFDKVDNTPNDLNSDLKVGDKSGKDFGSRQMGGKVYNSVLASSQQQIEAMKNLYSDADINRMRSLEYKKFLNQDIAKLLDNIDIAKQARKGKLVGSKDEVLLDAIRNTIVQNLQEMSVMTKNTFGQIVKKFNDVVNESQKLILGTTKVAAPQIDLPIISSANPMDAVSDYHAWELARLQNKDHLISFLLDPQQNSKLEESLSSHIFDLKQKLESLNEASITTPTDALNRYINGLKATSQRQGEAKNPAYDIIKASFNEFMKNVAHIEAIQQINIGLAKKAQNIEAAILGGQATAEKKALNSITDPVVIFGLDGVDERINAELEDIGDDEATGPVAEVKEAEVLPAQKVEVIQTTKCGPGKIYEDSQETCMYEEKSLIDTVNKRHEKLNEGWKKYSSVKRENKETPDKFTFLMG